MTARIHSTNEPSESYNVESEPPEVNILEVFGTASELCDNWYRHRKRGLSESGNAFPSILVPAIKRARRIALSGQQLQVDN